MPPVLVWLEVRGFRAFGTEVRRLDVDAPLIVVHGRNSQGKSSLAEAVEFLLTGRSSRRELLGGAKAEYHGSLRNVHLPDDQKVWVSAGVRDGAGVVHEVRRELVSDFGAGAGCDSRLLVDGVQQQDLAGLGLAAVADSPVSAPVLLQHTLRHVLSTEPKQRVTYFKALLALTDLDALRDRVARVRRRLEDRPPTAAGQVLSALRVTPCSGATAELLELDSVPGELQAAELVRGALLDSAERVLERRPTDLLDCARALRSAMEHQREAVVPLSALQSAAVPPPDPVEAEVRPYRNAIEAADRAVTALIPVFRAVLAVPEVGASPPTDCPVCATPGALTAHRFGVLRDELRRNQSVEDAARAALAELRRAADAATQLAEQVDRTVPAAGSWSTEQILRARQQVVDLGVDEVLLTGAAEAAAATRSAATAVRRAASALATHLTADLERVAARLDLDGEASVAARGQLIAVLDDLRHRCSESTTAAEALAAAVAPVTSVRTAATGLQELLAAVEHADDLAVEVRRDAARSAAVRRLKAAERALTTAAAAVLDTRFARMSGSITRWWLTIRPDEPVNFAGVQRRAGGAMFVNLMAALQPQPTADPVERHALGIFSDSQLNALGLATFLARTELLATPLMVLDDPVPGSDGDHRLTFVQNTLEGVLGAGTQVIMTTYDDRLADWAAAHHVQRDRRTFELTLTDHVAGTEPTQTSDVFDQLMLEAEDGLNAPSPKGRRAACTTYRTAAERLAKQIIATARTADGRPTTVADVEREAKVLGELVPLVRAFVRPGAEKGYWNTFSKILNPGSHDDDVPSTLELKQVRGNLRKIAKEHRAHWPGGLIT